MACDDGVEAERPRAVEHPLREVDAHHLAGGRHPVGERERQVAGAGPLPLPVGDHDLERPGLLGHPGDLDRDPAQHLAPRVGHSLGYGVGGGRDHPEGPHRLADHLHSGATFDRRHFDRHPDVDADPSEVGLADLKRRVVV